MFNDSDHDDEDDGDDEDEGADDAGKIARTKLQSQDIRPATS